MYIQFLTRIIVNLISFTGQLAVNNPETENTQTTFVRFWSFFSPLEYKTLFLNLDNMKGFKNMWKVFLILLLATSLQLK